MRDDNLFVHGFFNHNGVLYRLCDEEARESKMLHGYHHQTEDLKWGITYPSILKVDTTLRDDQKIGEIVKKLSDERDSSDERLLGSDFAMDAVRRLSSSRHPDQEVAGMMSARVALAGLIIIVCESARINPVHDSFAREWKVGTTRHTSSQLMKNYMWEWAHKSTRLRNWKARKYEDPQQCVSEVQDIYLVRNDRLRVPHQHAGSSGGDSSSVKQQTKKGSGLSPRPAGDSNNNSPPTEQGDNPNAPSQQNDEPGKSKGPSQPMEADDAQQGHGRPRVELLSLAMRGDLLVDGTEIVVFDGKRGQIIYRKDEQEEKRQREQVTSCNKSCLMPSIDPYI